MAPQAMLDGATRGEHIGNVAYERALLPSILHMAPKRSTEETFEWVMQPPETPVHGKLYSDGSRIDAEVDQAVARLGWSVVVVDGNGATIAAAKGRPPAWIVDIPGTEAWAIL